MYRSSLKEDLVGMKMKSICTDSSDQEKHSVDFTRSSFSVIFA